jgi:hypothetical protein
MNDVPTPLQVQTLKYSSILQVTPNRELLQRYRGRDSSVVQCWATGWMIGGFESQKGLGIFLFATVSRPALGPIRPPIQKVPGALSLGINRPGREADHSPTSSAEVKNARSYTSTPTSAFMAWCSVKAKGQFYLYIKLHKNVDTGPIWATLRSAAITQPSP